MAMNLQVPYKLRILCIAEQLSTAEGRVCQSIYNIGIVVSQYMVSEGQRIEYETTYPMLKTSLKCEFIYPEIQKA
jgi:hypothetical protein